MTATGGDYSAFTIDAKGISPLVVEAYTTEFATDRPVSLAWTPPVRPADTRVLVTVFIDPEGDDKARLVCDVDDTGSLQIGATLVTQLIGQGVGGFPLLAIERRAVGSTTIAAGRVDLLLVSGTEVPVTVAGFTSCQYSADCPDGLLRPMAHFHPRACLAADQLAPALEPLHRRAVDATTRPQ